MTNLADRVIDVQWGGRGCCVGEVVFEVGVGESGSSVEVKVELYLCDNVSAAVPGVEDTAAIAKVTLLRRKVFEGVGFKIQDTNGVDSLSDLLAIRSDVLDWSSADGAGDSGQALYPGIALPFAGLLHEVVPIVASGNLKSDRCGLIDEVREDWAFQTNLYDESIKACVWNEQVGAAPEREETQIFLFCKVNGLKEFGLTGYATEVAGRPADPEGGVGRERDVLLDVELLTAKVGAGGRWHGLMVLQRSMGATVASGGGVGLETVQSIEARLSPACDRKVQRENVCIQRLC